MSSVLITPGNYEEYLQKIMDSLSGKRFNILTETDGKNLKFCNRMMSGGVYKQNGQVSLPLKPGGSIAWDLNTESVKVLFDKNGDIVLYRLFAKGREKITTITQSPI